MSPTALHSLSTEQQNLESEALDTKSALEIVTIINREDAKVASAVAESLPQIAEAIDAVADSLSRGGRLIYVGAGTSGRIAALDATECPPTFSTDPRQVQFIVAGGERALGRAVEANEDSEDLGRRDLARLRPTKKDVVAGLAASGRTPYTIAAVEYAKKKGARTIGISCNADSPLARAADIAITAEVGPEVLSGSTRMKAGTSQKMILNMLTTGAMTRLGYVYGNLMVNVSLKNHKLLERAITILSSAADVDRETARATLKKSGDSVPVALIMLKAGIKKAEAAKRLKAARGNVRKAIELRKF
ncbi:MAG: N-acetylmuramic acid 6-phosphate etherase [Acidobacteria bacterium]|nr:N-acetylmuramic acid 6-phosphate etherase [Acidobacteriota bacterium]